MFANLFALFVVVNLVICDNFNLFPQKYEAVIDEINTATFHDDIMNLVGDLINQTNPSSIGVITDSIYRQHFNSELVSSLDHKIVVEMSIKDSQSFEDETSESFKSQLLTMKRVNCDLYIILITNGIQMTAFLKYADYHRLLDTRAKIVMVHDYRLFTSEMFFIWKRIVNVVFIRKREKQRWYELSTVPFPAKIQEVFVARVINFWSPSKRFRWSKRNIFSDKVDLHLNGVHLEVAVLQHTPTVYKKNLSENGITTGLYYGLEIDLIGALSAAMNFTVEYYESSDADSEKWGRQVDTGNYSGLLGEMEAARADIALGDLHYTMFNLDVMDLSLPYNTECLTFISPEQLSDNTWKTLILPFSLGMWIGVLLSLCSAGIFFFFFSKVYVVMKNKSSAKPKETNRSKDFFDDLSACVLYTFSMILLVSLPRLPYRWSVRVLTGWWWIYCILVVVAYRAALTSILANPQPRLTIDTLEVLAKSSLKCGAWGDQNRNFFLMSSDPVAQKIGSKMENIESGKDAITRVAEGGFAYFENQFTLQQLRFDEENFKASARQNLHIMEQCTVNIPVSIGLEKNSPLKEQMDKYIRWAIEGGLIQKWLLQATKSFESSIEPPPAEALMDLKKFYGALVALGCGYVLALIALAGEAAYWRFVIEKHPHYDKYFRKIVIRQDQRKLIAVLGNDTVDVTRFEQLE